MPIINLSTDGLKTADGLLPQSGNVLRANAIARARGRLGLDKSEAAYIPASNVRRNGEEYVLKITKASLNKMLSPSDGKAVPLESITVMDNIERIANNGVWFDSQPDRQNRPQINGIDHLMTTVYIDSAPYAVDMRVRLVQENKKTSTDNVLYYFSPEEILSIKKIDGSTTTEVGRQASNGEVQPPIFDPTIAPGESGVKGQDMQRGLGVYAPPGESIDSLIERMYNETEPDHFEPPAPPEEIPAADAEIIDREWGGGGEAYSPRKIEEFAKAYSAEIKSMTYQEIYDFCKGRKDLAESLILSIPESYGDEGLTLAQRAEKYDLQSEPKAQSLSAYQVRVWYRWQESLMAGRLDYSKPLEEVARQACAMRNTIRTQARDAMNDTTWAGFLKTTESNYTFEKLMEYYQEKGYVGNRLWEKIIEKSMQSRKGIDGLFGLNGAQ